MENSLVGKELSIYLQPVTILFSESPRCLRQMGMQEGAIWDDQLSASSALPGFEPFRARPGDVGWCAYAKDTEPYLQVVYSSTFLSSGKLFQHQFFFRNTISVNQFGSR